MYVYVYAERDEENTCKNKKTIQSLAKKQEAYLAHLARVRKSITEVVTN